MAPGISGLIVVLRCQRAQIQRQIDLKRSRPCLYRSRYFAAALRRENRRANPLRGGVAAAIAREVFRPALRTSAPAPAPSARRGGAHIRLRRSGLERRDSRNLSPVRRLSPRADAPTTSTRHEGLPRGRARGHGSRPAVAGARPRRKWPSSSTGSGEVARPVSRRSTRTTPPPQARNLPLVGATMSTTIPSGTDSEATPGELDAFAQNFFGFDSMAALWQFNWRPWQTALEGEFAYVSATWEFDLQAELHSRLLRWLPDVALASKPSLRRRA